MNRRGFLSSIIVAASAPAIIKAENAMKLWVPKTDIVRLNPEGIIPLLSVVTSLHAIIGDILQDSTGRTFLVVDPKPNKIVLAEVSPQELPSRYNTRLIPPGALRRVGS